jgi:Fungal protein kinase
MDGMVYDEREHRQIVCTWVEYSFNSAVDALIKRQDISSLGSLWQNAFQAIDAIVGKDVIHRDISFRNMRVNRQKRLQVSDFDMGITRGNSSGAKEITGTVGFMTCALLHGIATYHHPFHDCESVFWILHSVF